MESGMIDDQDITASSSFDHGNVGPRHGRVRNELNGGAWCPQGAATSDTKEWIEIDLHTVHVITATEVQGRFGNGLGVEFAEEYVVEYFRPRLNKWVRYRSKSNSHLLKGNVNTYLESKTNLDSPIWASKIRFLPYSSHRRTVCMRVEVYGCRWTDGIISYTMPQGDKKGTSWEFYDFAYDGHWDGQNLKFGLGQLVDGHTAPDDFKFPFEQTSLQSWVGWKNDARNNQPIDIVFEFDKPREFRIVNIHANNQFTREVQVFSVAKIYFSVDGKKYRGDPIIYEYVEDRIFENGRNISIKLHHRIGRFVKVQLHFAARWILVSEVSFDSSLASGNFTEEDDESELSDKGHQTVIRSNSVVNVTIPEQRDGVSFKQYLGILIGVLVLLVLVMIAVILYVIAQQRKYKDVQRPSQVADKATLYGIPPLADLININIAPDYADIHEFSEYAVPLQATYTSPTDTIRKPSTASSSEYYAAVDICKPDFIPPTPPPPIRSPVPKRGPLRYALDNNTYVGP